MEKTPLEKIKDITAAREDTATDMNLIEKEVKFDFTEVEEEKPAEIAKPVKKKKRKMVDINNINIIDKDVISRERDLKNALYGNRSAFQIVAAQSGYMAKVTPLVHKDTVNLMYSNLNRYEYKKAVYKVIYEKINGFSVGHMSFDEWLRSTSVEDIETFYYGIYCATFPNSGNFEFACPECGEGTSVKINNNTLFKTTNRNSMMKLIEKVSKEALSMDKMKEFSLIGKNSAFELDDSGIIVELRTPTLFDSLELLRVVPESTIDRDTTSVTNMLYIERILIPSKDSNGFTELRDRVELLRIIDNLSIEDAAEVQTAVFEKVDEHRITYSIKNLKCPKCGYEVKDIPVLIEDELFSQIFERTQ